MLRRGRYGAAIAAIAQKCRICPPTLHSWSRAKSSSGATESVRGGHIIHSSGDSSETNLERKTGTVTDGKGKVRRRKDGHQDEDVELIDRLFRAIDANGDGTIDYEELANGMDYLRGELERRQKKRARSPQPFTILSLDGGGVRGILTSTLLDRLNREVPGFLDRVDLFAGSSTGAIQALLLANGFPVCDMARLYKTACPQIFQPRSSSDNPWALLQSLQSTLNVRFPAWTANGFASLTYAKYSNDNLKSFLEAGLGNRTLGDLERKVLVTSFRLDGMRSTTHIAPHLLPSTYTQNRSGPMDSIGTGGTWRPSVFSNLPPVEGFALSDTSLLAVDAALRSTAAPTFFPVYQGYCDGAITGNNPALIAMGKVLGHYPNLHRQDIRILSLGTGKSPKSLGGPVFGGNSPSTTTLGGSHLSSTTVVPKTPPTTVEMDWGALQWAPHLVDMLMDASSLGTDLLTGLMIGRRNQYHRVECVRADMVSLDDVSRLDVLEDFARDLDIDGTVKWVKEEIMLEEDAGVDVAYGGRDDFGDERQVQF